LLDKKFWRFVTAILISLGIICCAIMSQTPTWWNKYSSYYNAQVASIINQYPSSLVITNRPRSSRITSLSYKLNPDLKIMLLDGRGPAFGERTESSTIPDNYSKVFLFRPYGELLEQLQSQNYKLTSLHERGYLWEINK
jgi:hypothetical protein